MRGWFGNRGPGGAAAEEFASVERQVGQGIGGGDAAPDDDLVKLGAEVEDTGDGAHFKEDDGAGEASGHPLAVLGDVAFEDESHGDGGGEDPDGGIGGGRESEAAGFSEALFKVLDVHTERRSEEDAGYVKASCDTVEFGKTLAEAVGELHGAEQEGGSGDESVGQEPPAEGMDVRPFGVVGSNEEALVMPQDIGVHEGDESEEKTLGAKQGAH